MLCKEIESEKRNSEECVLEKCQNIVTMGKHKGLLPLRVLSVLLPILLLSEYVQANNIENQHYMPPLECYDPYGRPQVRTRSIVHHSDHSPYIK